MTRLGGIALLVAGVTLSGFRAVGGGWSPPVEEVVPEYEVEVGGKRVKLLLVHMRYPEGRDPLKDVYWVANFPYAPGEKIRVTSTRSLAAAVLRPVGRVGALNEVAPNEVAFSAKKPFRVVLEREGRVRPLVLFGNAPERDVPDRNDPNVRWFGPGSHKVDALKLTSGQTLYLDYGATVYGAIHASGDDITIRGHGVFSGQIYRAWHGPAPMFFLGYKCRNLTVRDLVVTAPFSWTLALQDCEDSLVDDVKVCSSRMLADDGIDLVNCRRVTVRNCFVRSQDDVISFKGMDESRTPCEDILVENCDLWCDTANVFRFGYECHASGMGRLTIRDIEVLHYSPVNLPWRKQWSHAAFWLQPSGGMPLGDILVENVRIHSDGDELNLAIANPRVTACSPGECGTEGRKRVFYKGGGSVSNVTFRNVSVTGTPGPWRVVAEGLSERESVRNVRFENVTVFGKRLERGMPEAHVGPHATGIAFARSSKFSGFPAITPRPSHRKDWWPDRFKSNCERARALKDVDVVFAGDSITHFWENSGKAVWAEITNRYTAINAGYAGDRTENMLWRFRNGELDGYRAKLFLVLVGTNNNIGDGKPEETAAGIRLIVDEIRARQPQAAIGLMRLLPRAHRTDPETGDTPAVKNAKTSETIRQFADGDKIIWLDFDSRFRNDRGGPRHDLFFDSLHPSAKGYEVWRECLTPVIERYCGKRLAAVRTVPHELDELVETGHVQGADCSEEGVYLSHAGGIAMVDWSGKVIRRVPAPNHLGDVACHDGKVYGAFVLRGEVKDGKRGLVKVWNARLEPIAERYFTEPLDGITVLNGTIYIGVDLWGGVYHPHCCVKRLDLNLNDLGNVEFDLGYKILAGVQTMSTDGRDLFFGCYGGSSRVTPDLKANVKVDFACAEGFGRVPKSVSGRDTPVFFRVNALGGNMSGWRKDPVNNPPRIELRFFSYADGAFSDITSNAQRE